MRYEQKYYVWKLNWLVLGKGNLCKRILPEVCESVAVHQCPTSPVRFLVTVNLGRIFSIGFYPVCTRFSIFSFFLDLFA